jgi:hypothetical protein
MIFNVEDAAGFVRFHTPGCAGELAACKPCELFLLVDRNARKLKEVKAGAPYVFSRYGKEYGTPATRLLFERTLGADIWVVGTITHRFDRKL